MWPKANIFSIRFVLRRPSATPDRCGRRPTFFQFVFLASAFGLAGQMWPTAHIFLLLVSRVGLRPRQTDVAEGPHLFNLFF